MVKFYVRMAELVIAVSAMHEETKRFCKDYLLEEVPRVIDIEVCVTEEDILRERELCKSQTCSDRYLETLVLLRLIASRIVKFHRLFFHSSAIAVDGEVYLFTAPSGTGKSTHARIWRRHFGNRAVMVNDDKPFLCCEEKGKIVVYGSPWDGKHRLSNNVGLPLKGICILTQAEENRIYPVSPEDAFRRFYLQTYHVRTDAEHMKDTLECIGRILEYPIWHLECNISEEAARLSYETMSGNNWDEEVTK